MRPTTKFLRRWVLGGLAASALLGPAVAPLAGQEHYDAPVAVDAAETGYGREQHAAQGRTGPLRWNGGCCGTARNTGAALAGYVTGDAHREASLRSAEAQPPLELYPEGALWVDDGGPGYGIGCGSDCAPAWYTRAEAVYFQRDPDASRIGAGAPADEFEFEFGGRFTVGRYVDCVSGWEISVLAPIEYEQSGALLDPTGVGTLRTPFGDEGGLGANLLFDNAVAQQLVYESTLTSVEVNYVENGWDLITLLFGARYINIDEDFLYGALGPAGNVALLDIDAENHLIGLQLGGDLRSPVGPRGSFGMKAKLGGFVNPTDTRFLVAAAPGGVAIDNSDDEIGFSALAETGAFYQFQVLPGAVTARLGYEFWYLWGLALAPELTDFTLGAGEGTNVDVEDDLYFHGPTAGVEIVW